MEKKSEVAMGSRGKPLEVVRNVDLSRYIGRWYEIGCIPTSFQPKDGINTRATYTSQEDGTIGVLNETWTHGKRGHIAGKAWKADPASDEAKFIVQFRVPPFLPLFPVNGDYWILALDKENYNYAMVGEPKRNSLWVLARKPEMSDETYKELLEIAEKQGYDVNRVKKTHHDGSEEPAAANDNGGWWLRSFFQKT